MSAILDHEPQDPTYRSISNIYEILFDMAGAYSILKIKQTTRDTALEA